MNKAKLHKALLSAFPARAKLAMLLGQRFDVLYDTLTPASTLDTEYWTILVQVEAEGWLEAFARAAHEAVPGNALLAELILSDGLSSAAGLARPSGTESALQRLVREDSDFVDVPAFLARLTALEGQTCRIEMTGATTGGAPRALGTGFLVGPDLVMTNQHVVAAFDGARAACRFDYLTDAGGVEVRAGRLVGLAGDWLVASRPPDPSDESLDDNDLPAPENLDFALIRLAERLGEAPRQGAEGPENPARGWLAIDPAREAQEGADLFVLQHPEGAPLKLGVGRLTSVRGGGLRWRHDVATEGGSSGSPVLDRGLALIGLHHAGDPNFFRTAQFNQAVPMARIIGWLDGKVDPFWTEAPP